MRIYVAQPQCVNGQECIFHWLIWCLTHCGSATWKLTNNCSNNGLVPLQHWTIIRVKAMVNWTFRTNIEKNCITIKISLIKIQVKMLSAKCQPFCSGLNIQVYNKAILFTIYHTQRASNADRVPKGFHHHAQWNNLPYKFPLSIMKLSI